MLRATPVRFTKNPKVMADKSEMKRPEANNLGNVALTISAAFLSSRTLNIVGDTTTEKNNSIPSKIELSTIVITTVFLILFVSIFGYIYKIRELFLKPLTDFHHIMLEQKFSNFYFPTKQVTAVFIYQKNYNTFCLILT